MTHNFQKEVGSKAYINLHDMRERKMSILFEYLKTNNVLYEVSETVIENKQYKYIKINDHTIFIDNCECYEFRNEHKSDYSVFVNENSYDDMARI